jgi:hypothetical protein
MQRCSRMKNFSAKKSASRSTVLITARTESAKAAANQSLRSGSTRSLTPGAALLALRRPTVGRRSISIPDGRSGHRILWRRKVKWTKADAVEQGAATLSRKRNRRCRPATYTPPARPEVVRRLEASLGATSGTGIPTWPICKTRWEAAIRTRRRRKPKAIEPPNRVALEERSAVHRPTSAIELDDRPINRRKAANRRNAKMTGRCRPNDVGANDNLRVRWLSHPIAPCRSSSGVLIPSSINYP